MKYQLSEDGAQITKVDGKVVANIAGGEITPTAPVYYKFLDEFRLLVAGKPEAQESALASITQMSDDEQYEEGFVDEETQDDFEAKAFGPPDDSEPPEATAERLHAQIDDLKRQLEEKEEDSPEIQMAKNIEAINSDDYEALSGKAIHAVWNTKDWGDDPEPKTEKRWGLKTPGYPSWLQRNDPAKAAEIYKGRNVAEYEEACKITG